jgi:hypothetical protein
VIAEAFIHAPSFLIGAIVGLILGSLIIGLVRTK